MADENNSKLGNIEQTPDGSDRAQTAKERSWVVSLGCNLGRTTRKISDGISAVTDATLGDLGFTEEETLHLRRVTDYIVHPIFKLVQLYLDPQTRFQKIVTINSVK
ncbi:MAG: hypothetical protein GY847_17485 [Proteobacteria bacterium]|nr:hypothetical protein [Pseudomonadota bacterium]